MFSHSTPSIPLDETYTDFSIEKLFAEYKKAITELTIDESERLKIKNDKLQKEKSEAEKEKQRYAELLGDYTNFKDETKSYFDELERKINQKNKN